MRCLGFVVNRGTAFSSASLLAFNPLPFVLAYRVTMSLEIGLWLSCSYPSPPLVAGLSEPARYEAYRSGSVCWKFSSSGPRFAHGSAAEKKSGVEEGSAGVQCAAEGVKIAAGAGSATTVQRQCVRVGAARADVERRRALARSEAGVVRSIVIDISVLEPFARVEG